MGEVRCRVYDGRPDNFNLSVGPAVAYCGDRVAVLWRSGHCAGGVLIYYKDYSKRAERCIPRRTEYDRSGTVHITGPVRIFAERGDCLHDVRRPVRHIGVQPGILPDGILCK